MSGNYLRSPPQLVGFLSPQEVDNAAASIEGIEYGVPDVEGAPLVLLESFLACTRNIGCEEVLLANPQIGDNDLPVLPELGDPA
jgi:hypothetical protein